MEEVIDIPKKQNSIEDLPRLSNEIMENMFRVYKEKNSGKYFYNILQTLAFPKNLPANFFTKYVIGYGDTWPLVSHKNYNTPNLWWIILHANNILDATKPLVPGQEILMPKLEFVNAILAEIDINS